MVLFEGNNHIPFFWLMLFGQEDVDFLHEKICRPVHNRTEYPASATLSLDKIKALIRTADRRSYVERYYASGLPLYDDWLYFMQISDFSDMRIYVDLYDISSCHESPERFVESLRKAIACFDENREVGHDNVIADMCGYEGRNKNKKRFSDFSDAYRMMNRKEIYGRFDKKLHLGKKKSRGRKTGLFLLLVAFVALLIAGIALFMLR
ncbi:MAG: hypothetical protein LBT83_06345 [Tannerella sp.]|nr:hypothetical protein [Tannerella sp.]